MNILLEAGADVNPRTGTPPIELAARRGDLEKARTLIAHGANVNNGFALAAAAGNDRLEIVKLLLASGVNPNLADSYGRTALHWAVGHDAILTALIQAGADVNAKGKDGRTPLVWAVERDDIGAVKILLQAGANPAVKTRDVPSLLGRTQAHQIAAALLEHSSAIDADAASHLLDLSAHKGWADVASLVVQRGFNVKGAVGELTLRDATEACYPNVMRVLLEAGTDPNAADTTLRRPIQYAVSACPHNFNSMNYAESDAATRFEMIQLLVSHGANVNLKLDQNLESDQPIGIAVAYLPPPDLKTVEFLLAHGAVVTPSLIELARYRNRPDLVALLLKPRPARAPAKK